MPPVPRRTPLRVLLPAAALFAPLVVLEMVYWQPFVASTFASTAAVALHDPDRYRRDWVRILRCYVLAFAATVPLSLGGTALALPEVVLAVVAAVLLLTSRSGRFHPPIACVPFAITTIPSAPVPVPQVVVAWLVVLGATGYVLLALVVLIRATRRPDSKDTT
jgi:hypothetical protein